MTTHESKLEKKLERRLQEHALQEKNKIFSPDRESNGVNSMVRTPSRIHPQTIQRAQFYTGDA